MKILVTGGNGFVGRNLIPVLISQGHTVTVLDNLSSDSQLQNKDSALRFIQGNIANAELVKKVFSDGSFDLVYHLAAIVGIKNYIERPFELVDVNIWGTRLILEECIKGKVRLLFSSTSEIYGKNPLVPWKEEDDRVLGSTHIERWIYSSSKSVCEHLIFAAVKKLELRASIVRYFNLYGPMQHPTNIVSRNIARTLTGKRPLIYDDGKMQRCFTYIDDGIQGTIAVAESDKALGQVFNIGSNIPLDIATVTQEILKCSESTLEPEYVNTSQIYGDSYEDLRLRIPSVQKAKNYLNWSASTPFELGIRNTVNWYKQNPEWWSNFSF